MFLQPLKSLRQLVAQRPLFFKSPRHYLQLSQWPLIVTSLLVTGLIVGARQLGQLQRWELSALDLFVRSTTQATLDPRLLIVEVNEEDIQQQQQWPLSDQVIARLLRELQQHQPKVIGLDLYRDIPQAPGHEELVAELTAQNIIGIRTLEESEESYVPPPPNLPEEQIGFNDLVIDPDNVVRRNLMYVRTADHDYLSFALRLSLHYLDDPDLQVTPDFLRIEDTFFPALESDSGSYQMHPQDMAGWQVLLNYPDQDIAQRLSLSDVLAGNYDPAWLQDRIILIGTTAPSGKDLLLTPFSAGQSEMELMPGVVVHAQMVSQILSTIIDQRPLWWYWSEESEILWIFGWSLLGVVVAWFARHPLALMGTGAVVLAGNYGISWFLFLQGGWIPLIPSAIAFLLSGASILAYNVLYHSSRDSLTGLPNRSSLLRRIQTIHQQQSSGTFLAVLCLDLDRFKVINESFGHQVGDQLLKIASQRIRRCLSAKDIVARVGGDEFAVLLTSLKSSQEVMELANHLQQELQTPMFLNEHQVHTTISVGIALNNQSIPINSETLVRNAHTAMNRAKESGAAHCTIFVEGMHDQAVYRLELEEDLRHAIQAEEFQLYYQPIIKLKTGKISGFEALVRWNSPKRGFVSPGQFIPLAEETGLIVPLGAWILQEACQQIYSWQGKFPQIFDITMSINLSGRQFSEANFVEYIEAVLQKTSLNPTSLKLEITESMIMHNVEETLKQLHALKGLGIQLSIDDFGTGYSSLSYLHRFPIDTLKIDQSFVRRIQDNWENSDIARTIIGLSHNLNMEVIAEGIETDFQLACLRSLDCQYGQGYFFAKPMPREDIETLLLADPRW